MNTATLTAEFFVCGVYEYNEEAINMQAALNANDELVGGFSTDPILPNIVSLDMLAPLNELTMYTNNLQELAAPHELCVQKALELISSVSNYNVNLEAFRMELLSQVLAETGIVEVNAIVEGIRRLCDFLLVSFDKVAKFNADLFPYEFYTLHNGRYLFLSKIVFNAKLRAFNPYTIAKPAYSYSQVQARHRADYTAKADQCIVL